MIKEDPYTGMQYIGFYPDEDGAEPSAEERMMAAPVAGFFTLLMTLIFWIIVKVLEWITMYEEYERAKEKRDYSKSIEILDSKLKKRRSGVREKYIWENGKWVRVDV